MKRSARPAKPRRRSSTASSRRARGGGRRSRADDRGGRPAGGLHRSRRGSRVQSGGHGRRMQRVAKRARVVRRLSFRRRSPTSVRGSTHWDWRSACISGSASRTIIDDGRGPADVPLPRRTARRAQSDSSARSRRSGPHARRHRRRSTSTCAATSRSAPASGAAPPRPSRGCGCASWSTAPGPGTKSSSAASKIEGHPDNAAAGALRRRDELLRDATTGTIAVDEVALAGAVADRRGDAGSRAGDRRLAPRAAEGAAARATRCSTFSTSRCSSARCNRAGWRTCAKRCATGRTSRTGSGWCRACAGCSRCGILM